MAQTPSADSVITLRPVTVYGVPEARFAAGSKRETPDSLLRAHGQAGTLAGLLMQASPVYVREYGAGMLASVSFRGTAASHTALLWNGVNLNLLTLGQTDFNLVPLGAAQQVELHYGGASALYGSDALGGSIHLYSQPSWRPGVTGKFQQTVGSFGQFYTQAQAQVGRGRSEFRLNAYHQTTRNDFPFRNVARPGAPLERQTNAALRNYGLQPEFYYRFSPGRYLSVKGWYTYADRQIQPTMAATDVTDQQQDEGQRLVADYHDRSALGQFNLKLAYLQDWLRYNLGPRSLTRRYLGALSYEKRLGRQWQVQAGGNWQHIAAQVANYGHPLSENQAEAYALLRYEPNTRLVLTANFRQNWVSGQATTPAPALGAEWQLWQTGPAEQPRHQLRWKTALSR
ncbi:MAG: TonB-dependent receptor, partial [Bernardetiaceae bacterium]|nr:TonB-dependent receptor [Bernardetiaceae bacterium]